MFKRVLAMICWFILGIAPVILLGSTLWFVTTEMKQEDQRIKQRLACTTTFGPPSQLRGSIMDVQQIEVLPHDFQPWMSIKAGGWDFLGCCGEPITSGAYKEIASFIKESEGAWVQLIASAAPITNNRGWDVEIYVFKYGKRIKLSDWIKEKKLLRYAPADERIPKKEVQ